MPDEHGYPTAEELLAIKEWDVTEQGIDGFVELIRMAWNHHYGNFSTEEELDDIRSDRKIIQYLYLSTGGWSGNEDVMRVVRANRWFEFFCWEESRRGGHYKYQLHDCLRKPDAAR